MRIDLVSAFFFFLFELILGQEVQDFLDTLLSSMIIQIKHHREKLNIISAGMQMANGRFTYIYFLAIQGSKIGKKWLGRRSRDQDVNILHEVILNAALGPKKEPYSIR